MDFLNKYDMSFEQWQDLMSEWVESIFSFDNAAEVFKSYVQGKFLDYPIENEKNLDKRTRSYKQYKKELDTWREVLAIAEGCIVDSPANILDQQLAELEPLYNNPDYDKSIVQEAVYYAATCYQSAKRLEALERRYYIITDTPEITADLNIVLIDDKLHRLGDEIEITESIQLFDDFKWARRAGNKEDAIVRCKALNCNDKYEVTKIKLVKIVER